MTNEFKKISHTVTQFKKGNGVRTVGVYYDGEFSQEDFDKIYGGAFYPGFILNEVKDTYAQLRFDSESGDTYYIVQTSAELRATEEAELKAKEVASLKAKAEAESLASFISKEEALFDKIVSDYSKLIQIHRSDLANVWSRLEFRNYAYPDTPYVNDYHEMYKSVNIYGKIVPIVDESELTTFS